MKRWIAIFIVAALVAWAIVETVHDFKANDTIGYFAQNPYRLIYVFAISLVGGLGALVFDRLSPSAKRNVKLFALGGAATFFTGFTVYMLYGLVSVCSLLVNASDGVAVCVWIIPFLFGGFAALFWLEYYHLWKTGRTRFF